MSAARHHDMHGFGCVLAAGEGTRMSAPADTPKALQRLAGRNLVEYAVESLSALDIPIVLAVPVGTRERFAGVRSLNECLILEFPPVGVVRTIRLILRRLSEHYALGYAAIGLGDDVTLPADASALVDSLGDGVFASQAAVPEDELDRIARSCEVVTDGDRIIEVREDPVDPQGPWRGCGIYAMSADAVSSLLRMPEPTTKDTLSHVFTRWAATGRHLAMVPYLASANVNTSEDLVYAEHLLKRSGIC